MKKLQKKYNILIGLIHKYGTKFDKQHGNWIRLKYLDDYYFCMDSWNKRICLKQNAGYVNKWGGFNGKLLYNLGIDFGGFRCDVLEEQLDCWIDEIKRIYQKEKADAEGNNNNK